MDVDAFTVAGGAALACGVALVGWVLGARSAPAGAPARRLSRRGRITVVGLIVASAVAAAVVAPLVGVFWALLALNLLLGRREHVPFSTYAMFSIPPRRAWALRFEDPDGEVVRVGEIGLAPNFMRKRFETELQALRAGGLHDAAAARRRAAAVIATLVEQRRPPGGPWAAMPITIVLVDYVLERGRVVIVTTPIGMTTPE